MGAAGGPGAGPRSRIFRDSKHGAALRHLPSGCHQVNTAWLRGGLLPVSPKSAVMGCHLLGQGEDQRRGLHLQLVPRLSNRRRDAAYFLHGLLTAALLLALAMVRWSRGSAIRTPATAAKVAPARE
jgi:hypothetical protein